MANSASQIHGRKWHVAGDGTQPIGRREKKGDSSGDKNVSLAKSLPEYLWVQRPPEKLSLLNIGGNAHKARNPAAALAPIHCRTMGKQIGSVYADFGSEDDVLGLDYETPSDIDEEHQDTPSPADLDFGKSMCSPCWPADEIIEVTPAVRLTYSDLVAAQTRGHYGQMPFVMDP